MCKILSTCLAHNKSLMNFREYTSHSVIKENIDMPICTTAWVYHLYCSLCAQQGGTLPLLCTSHRYITFTILFSFTAFFLTLC